MMKKLSYQSENKPIIIRTQLEAVDPVILAFNHRTASINKTRQDPQVILDRNLAEAESSHAALIMYHSDNDPSLMSQSH